MTDTTRPRLRRFNPFGRRPLPYDPTTGESFSEENKLNITKWWETPEITSQTAAPQRAGLLASAVRITGKTVASSAFRRTTHQSWQDDAWAMFDLVGELRFLSTTLAQRTSKARLYIGKVAPDQNQDPVVINDDPQIAQILKAIGDGQLGMSQLIQRLTMNLFITGDGWLVGIPKNMIQEFKEFESDYDNMTPMQIDRTPNTVAEDKNSSSQETLDSLEWKMLSISEVQFLQSNTVRLQLGPTEAEMLTVDPDDIYLIRVWRPHPRYWWQSDSPTRSSLPVLRELVGLTMHISAQVDSRLAGAGLFIIPESASRAIKRAAGLPDDSPEDPFTDALMEAMLTPIGDRSNASALVPLVVTAPDDVTKMFEYMTFSKPLDTESRPLRDEAIRRLALGLDAPPELLLGTNAMNHWGAWLVQEDVVSAHIEPPLQLICDALTTQYLRPILIESGMDEDEAEEYVVWYDVSDMIIRPNRGPDAQILYDKGVLSDAALRSANGFDESDAPKENTDDPAITAAFQMVKTDPGLMLRPGLDVIVEQLRALLEGNPMGATDGLAKNIASKAIAGPNVEDRDNPTIEPVSPPAPVPATPGTPVVPASGSVKSPAAIPQTNAAPAPINGSTPAPLTVKDSSSFGVRGSLSAMLADLDQQLDSDIVDLTGL